MKNVIKKASALVLGLLLAVTIGKTSVEASDYVTPSQAKVLVDGQEIAFEAYKINNNNYFKLRDLAKVVSGTKAQFNVKWDSGKGAINLVTNNPYEAVGGELEKSNIVAVKITENVSPIYKNGEKITMQAYSIGGNNYFKLRDMGLELNFAVSFDSDTDSVLIDTGGAIAPGVETPEKEETTENPVDSKENILKDLDEYKLKIEYKDDDIEYKYDLDKDGSVDAEIDDEVNNKKTKGAAAQSFIESKLLQLDYTGEDTAIIERILNSLGVSKEYKKIKLEIEYNNKEKLEIEIKNK